MKTLFAALLLICSLPAQFIGDWYGVQAFPYPSSCGPITAPWIYAHGSNHLGGSIIIRGISRELWYESCPSKPTDFMMTLALGWHQDAQILPALITGYQDMLLLCTWDAVAGGLHQGDGPEYYHMFQLPTDQSFVGLNFYAQWGMIFFDPAMSGWRIMTSQGLRIQIEQ